MLESQKYPSGVPQKNYKNVFLRSADAITEEFNGGLSLKKDQGFQFLTTEDKAFLIAYIYSNKNNKPKAYCEAVLSLNFDELDIDNQNVVRIKAQSRWKAIENKMGGVRNIISLLGVDVVSITEHAKRLLKAKKMVLDKDGNEHYMDDGATQFKALEFLSKLSGNYSEELNVINRQAININFQSPPNLAEPGSIESDNMEFFEGDYTAEEVEEE